MDYSPSQFLLQQVRRRSLRACIVLLTSPFVLTACGGGTPPDDPGTEPPVVQPPVQSLPAVIINEAVASNAEFDDDDGDSSDWLELYNTTAEPISLAGWTLSDKPDEPDQWALPEITLAGGQTLLIWASDKDRTSPSEPLHTNFKLSSDGETLVLHDSSGAMVDSLDVTDTPAGVSVGTSANDGSVVYFDEPTPGAANSAREYQGVVSGSVSFSHTGGVDQAASIELTHPGADVEVRYTLDSTIPNAGSALFAEPISVDGNTVVRARAFREGYIPSTTDSRTYLADANHEIAVVTLVTDPLNLFDIETGIYERGPNAQRQAPHYGANFWEDWERDIHFSFYEPGGELGTAFNAGVKIFGGWSRAHDQKSLAIFARGAYGTKEIEYPFFDNRSYDEFQALVLRNSGNDWMYTMLRDASLTSLMEGADIEVQAFRPAATYINGDYWGMYNLREKVNEHFLASAHDLDADDITILENNAMVNEGSNEEYLQLLDFIASNDMSMEQNYQAAADQIDIDNYIIYQVAEIFFNNTDWPQNNVKFWKSPETKWRWVLYDTEYGAGLYDEEDYLNNNLARALNPGGGFNDESWSTALFRGLMASPIFREQFINRFADELNSRFLPENTAAHVDQRAAVIASEMPAHFDRWAPIVEDDPRSTRREWTREVENLKDFLIQRPAEVFDHIVEQFDLAGIYSLRIENLDSAAGSVQVNSLEIAQSLWQGEYFADIPVRLSAVAEPGYEFAGWGGAVESTEATINLALQEDVTLTPVFVPVQ